MHFENIQTGMTQKTAPAIIENEKMLTLTRLYDPLALHTDEELPTGTATSLARRF